MGVVYKRHTPGLHLEAVLQDQRVMGFPPIWTSLNQRPYYAYLGLGAGLFFSTYLLGGIPTDPPLDTSVLAAGRAAIYLLTAPQAEGAGRFYLHFLWISVITCKVTDTQ